MQQLTSFGKICRKLRIDKDQALLDMASCLGVKPSFLSAVENGRKNVPKGWCEILREKYDLTEVMYNELLEARELSKTQLKLNLEQCNEEERDLAVSFARTFENLSEDQRTKILEILKK